MITSLDNKLVKDLVRLHQKKYREDSFLLFDEKESDSNAVNDFKIFCKWSEITF